MVLGCKSSPTAADGERPGEMFLAENPETEAPSILIDADVGSSLSVSSAASRLFAPAKSPSPMIDGSWLSSVDVGTVVMVLFVKSVTLVVVGAVDALSRRFRPNPADEGP